MNCVTCPSQVVLPYSATYTPAITPMGVPKSVARPTIVNDPKMALARPPVSAMGGGVISVNTARLRPPMPKRMVSIRIQISQNTPKAIAASDSAKAN